MEVGNSAKQSTLAASHGMERASELHQIRTNMSMAIVVGTNF